MAFNVKRINPLDLQPRKAIGVDLPFEGSAVFNSTYETKDALKANLINYFLTNKGERYLNPNFGSNIKSLLFENIDRDQLDLIESTIEKDLTDFFPNIQPTLIQVASDPDTNAVIFFLRYSIRDTNVQDELVINFEQ